MVGHGRGKCNSGHVAADLLNVSQEPSEHSVYTPSQPPFYILTLNKVDEDNWWWWSLLEREANWRRNKTQNTGSVGKLKLFWFPFCLMLGGGGIIILIMDHSPGHTFYDMQGRGLFCHPYPEAYIYMQKQIFLCPILGKDAVECGLSKGNDAVTNIYTFCQSFFLPVFVCIQTWNAWTDCIQIPVSDAHV